MRQLSLPLVKANAESYRLAVDAMGKENFTTYKVTEEIGKNKIKVMPDLLINGGNGGNGGSIDGLLGLQILDMMGKKVSNLNEPQDNKEVKEVTVEDVTKGKKK